MLPEASAVGKPEDDLSKVFSLVVILIATAVALPLVALIWLAAAGQSAASGDTWAHLAATVLPRYAVNSAVLAFSVTLGVVTVGVATAWLVTRYDFAGRRVLEWALILPLAMPAYVIAYAYTDALQFTGPVQTGLRAWLGMDGVQWQAAGYRFPEVRSLAGLVCMLIFVLYPYVYLPARAAFLERAASVVEAGRVLGVTGRAAFFRLSLPLARPAIAGGAALALMEALADYGAASYFAVETFTTGIYKAWFGLQDVRATAQLALTLLGFVLLLKLIEHVARGRARFASGGTGGTGGAGRTVAGEHLPLRRAWLPIMICFIPVLAGFFIPVWVLMRLLLHEWGELAGTALTAYWRSAGNSFLVALLAALLAVACAVLLAYAARLGGRLHDRSHATVLRACVQVAAAGYALPGAVLAFGILIPLTRFDLFLSSLIADASGGKPMLLLTGSVAGLVYAYLVRLIAVALTNVESGLVRITPSMDDAARALGASATEILMRVHAPLLWRSLLVAGLFVFVDALKELPATLVLRPFNFDTLATAAYTLTKDERLGEAALPCLTLVAVGLIPLVWVARALGLATRANRG